MSRKAHAIKPASDDTSVSTADLAKRWSALFDISLPPHAGRWAGQAVAWHEQRQSCGDVAARVQRDLDIIADDIAALRSVAGSVANAPPLAQVEQGQREGGDPARDAGVAEGKDTAPPLAPAPLPLSIPRHDRKAATRSAATPSRASSMPPASSQLVPGTRLVKSHGGRTHVVEVTASGVLYDGTAYRSLSAVAKAITGTHWNGLLFFGLRKRKTYPARTQHG